MSIYSHTVDSTNYQFKDLKTLLAKASPLRSGDELAGVAAQTELERAAAQMALSDVPLKNFLNEALVPYEIDEITRLIMDEHDGAAFAPYAHFTVGDLRNWLLSEFATSSKLAALSPGLTPEMVAAVSKIMRIQDLVVVAKKCQVVTTFRSTVGLSGRLSTRLQPNHPTDDPYGIIASTFDGLMYASGDALIGINPASDNVTSVKVLLSMLDELIGLHQIPTQSCVLTHITNTIQAIDQGAPVDLVFQSIAGTQDANTSFGVNLALLSEGRSAGLSLQRNAKSNQVMYFETGQGSALSARANHGMDQQTCEVRAYAVARKFNPFLVNTVVGFIGPEYLYDAKQIIRAGLEDHFCGKLMGLPMGCDICYTNHAQADQGDMDVLLTMLSVAGINFVMGIPGSDDVMLNYQTTSFHDAMYVRQVLGLRPAPEFEEWLRFKGIFLDDSGMSLANAVPPSFGRTLSFSEG